ncbi:MAG: hypothetical protein P8X57_04960, partial [Cyclobacteriaceae bacterium]
MKLTLNIHNSDHANMVIPFLKNQVDFDRIHELTGIRLDQEFDGSFKSIEKIYLPDNQVIYLLGLGEETDHGRWHIPFRLLAFRESKFWKNGVTIECQHLASHVQEAAALGIRMSAYQIGAYKS